MPETDEVVGSFCLSCGVPLSPEDDEFCYCDLCLEADLGDEDEDAD